VARVAFGVGGAGYSGGGVCYDLNPPFAWVLRQLGAEARLCAAWVAAGGGGYPATSTHVVVVVAFADGSKFVADPAFGDPPRTAVGLAGESAEDGLSIWQVVQGEEGLPEGCTSVVQCQRGSLPTLGDVAGTSEGSQGSASQGSATGEAGVWSPAYAFRPEDDLALDAEVLSQGLEEVLAPGKTFFSEKRLLVLGTPRGHVVLSERRMRRVEGREVAEEVAVESEEDWRRHAISILGRPLLTPPPKQAEAPKKSVDKVFLRGGTPWSQTSRGDAVSAGSQMGKAYASQGQATAKALNLGLVNSASLATGGAGAGGGLGLNAPGFGPKVQHFSGGGLGTARGKSLQVSDDAIAAWAQIMDDGDPTNFIYCEYAPDGRSLELTKKGSGGLSEFKATLGESIAWGGFRCYAVDKRGSVECRRAKFIFVQHKPEGASAMKKAKQGSHRGDVKEALTGTHMDIVVETLEDLQEETLIGKLQAAAGAHKPNGYMFDEGAFLEADYYGLGIGKDCKGETSKN